MKTAQEVRAGNVIMIGNDPMVVQKAEFNKSGRNASVVRSSSISCPIWTETVIAPTRNRGRSGSIARK